MNSSAGSLALHWSTVAQDMGLCTVDAGGPRCLRSLCGAFCLAKEVWEVGCGVQTGLDLASPSRRLAKLGGERHLEAS